MIWISMEREVGGWKEDGSRRFCVVPRVEVAAAVDWQAGAAPAAHAQVAPLHPAHPPAPPACPHVQWEIGTQLRAALEEPGSRLPGFMRVCDCIVRGEERRGVHHATFNGMILEKLNGGPYKAWV